MKTIGLEEHFIIPELFGSVCGIRTEPHRIQILYSKSLR